MYLSQTQVQDILSKAPPGTKPGDVIRELVQRGYQLEGFTPPGGYPNPQTVQNLQQQKSVGGFVGNVFKSAGNLVKHTAQAVFSPIDTAKAIGKVGLGAVEKVVPGRQGAETEFDAVAGFFKERYGSLDALKNTAYNDPVGFAADLSTILGGGAGALKAAGTISKSSTLAKAGTIAGRASELTNPLIAPTKTVATMVPKQKISSLAQTIYERALKPSSRLTSRQRSEIILTGLREGVPISKKGLDMTDNLIDELNGQISAKIKTAASNGDTIDLADVQSYTSSLRDWANHSLSPNFFLKQIDDIEADFMRHPLAKDGRLPIDKAQKIKTTTYQILRKSYGEMKNMEIEASKALARGLKDEIATKIPELAKINPRESALLAFERELEKAVGRIGKGDIIDLGTEGAAIAGTVAAGPGGGILAGLANKILSMPEVRSKLAILLQKVADKRPARPGQLRRNILPAGRLIHATQESQAQYKE